MHKVVYILRISTYDGDELIAAYTSRTEPDRLVAAHEAQVKRLEKAWCLIPPGLERFFAMQEAESVASEALPDRHVYEVHGLCVCELELRTNDH